MSYYTSNIKVDLTTAVIDKEIIQAGDFLMLDKCDNEVSVRLDNNKNHEISMRRKDYIETSFSRFYVTGPRGSDAYFKTIGSQDESVKVKSATRVISEVLEDKSKFWPALTKEDHFFAGYNQIGSPSNYPHVMLYNPVDSGKIGIANHVQGIGDSSQNGDHIHLHIINDLTDWVLGVQGKNKCLSKNAGLLGVYYQNSLSLLGDDVADNPVPLYHTMEFIKDDSSVIIPEGYGIAVIGGSPNQDISAYFEWCEHII